MFIEYIFVFILGLLIGSFLNVCIYRIPKEESVVFPSSHCMSCGNRLKPLDLIPVISYIFLRGRCRYCKAKVSLRYPLVEFMTGVTFLSIVLKYEFTYEFFAYAFLMSVLIAVFFIDLDHMIIPDGLVIAGLIGGVITIIYNIFRPLEIYGDNHWWNPLMGILCGSGFLFIVALIAMKIYKSDEAFGMGDVKIFAPIGLFLGWKITIVCLFVSIILSGLISVILMILRKKGMKSTIPLGPFIVIGTFISLMWGWDLLRFYLSMNGY